LLVPYWSLDGAACAPPMDEAHLRSRGAQQQFIRWHRALLEYPAVSSQLHRWFDLTFGAALAGAPVTCDRQQ